MRLAAHVKGGDAVDAAERQGRVVAERVRPLQGVVAVDADRLDAAADPGGDDRVRAAVARLERVDALGPIEHVQGWVGAVLRLAGRLHGAVVVHAYELDGVVAVRGHHGVRAVPGADGVDVQRVGERGKARVAGAGRPGRDQQGNGGVDQDVARVRERAGGAGGRQRGDGVARQVSHAPDQGGRPVVAKVVGAVAGPHHVGKVEPRRAVARIVRGRPGRPAEVEVQHGRRARVRDPLAELDGHGDFPAGAVRPVLRGDGHDRRRPRVDGDVPEVGERIPASRGRQGAAGKEAGGRVRDRAAAQDGVEAGIVEVGHRLVRPHRVAEHELRRVVARKVVGRAARVEPQVQRPRDADGGFIRDCNVDFGARGVVQAVGGRRVDRHDRRHPSVDYDVLEVGKRPSASVGRQGAVGREAGRHVCDRAGARQGAGARMLEVGRVLALPHRVVEHQRIAVVAREERGRGARAEPQIRRISLDADGAVKPDGDGDFRAGPVRGVGGRRGDAGGVRRRQPHELKAAVARPPDGEGVGAAAQCKHVDIDGRCEPWKAAVPVRRAGREQVAVLAHADQLDGLAGAAGGNRGVRAAAGAAKDVYVGRAA